MKSIERIVKMISNKQTYLNWEQMLKFFRE